MATLVSLCDIKNLLNSLFDSCACVPVWNLELDQLQVTVLTPITNNIKPRVVVALQFTGLQPCVDINSQENLSGTGQIHFDILLWSRHLLHSYLISQSFQGYRGMRASTSLHGFCSAKKLANPLELCVPCKLQTLVFYNGTVKKKLKKVYAET